MRLAIPLLSMWPVVAEGPPREVEVLPGVSLTVGELDPLPADLRAWGEKIVFGELPRDRVRVALISDIVTESGWRVTFFGSDVLDDAGASRERRLDAVYVFEKWGGAARLRSANVARFDSVVKEVTAQLLKAEPDFAAGQVLSVHELWEGLQVEGRSETRPVTASESWPSSVFSAMPEG